MGEQEEEEEEKGALKVIRVDEEAMRAEHEKMDG